uniref:Transposase IS4-like domain-containing protein n=1 Tax=Bacillus thuringiensis TaxID=1428 RepID=Q9X6I5_BACTU|nr:unknown [Bacillus thuringiensis]
MKQVHELYSLRWQIEIVFKTWKSLFDIDHCRTVKQERIECHLYGKLIAIFLCSSTMFKMRQLLLQKKQKELSEYKSHWNDSRPPISPLSSHTKHPRDNKAFNPPVPPSREKRTEISQI